MTISKHHSVRLSFTRLFTTGNLEGLTHADALGFCHVRGAKSWVSKINANNAEGSLNYKIVQFTIEAV